MNKVFAAPPRTERELKSLHRRVVRKITAMSPAERMATIVSAGIVTKNGKRTKKYGG
jgi:ABC-type transport system involved in Fe-S cluster assembly fused permease/ATPase subunit